MGWMHDDKKGWHSHSDGRRVSHFFSIVHFGAAANVATSSLIKDPAGGLLTRWNCAFFPRLLIFLEVNYPKAFRNIFLNTISLYIFLEWLILNLISDVDTLVLLHNQSNVKKKKAGQDSGPCRHWNRDPGRATAFKSWKPWMSSASTWREEDRRTYRLWR